MGFRNSTGGGITQLTGEVTAGPGEGSQVATLAPVITAGSVGGASAVPEITYNDAGQITGIASTAPNDATKIPLSTVTAAGDLIVGTGAGAVSRLGIGADGDVLTVAAGALGYAAPASAGLANYSAGPLSNVPLTANVVTPVVTTPVLAVGTWLLIATLAFAPAETLTTIAEAVANVSAGTATATFSMPNGSENGVPSTNGNGMITSVTLTELITVTVAGTVNITGYWYSSGNNAGQIVGSQSSYVMAKIG